MAGKAGTLETLAQQVGLALQPLESQLTSVFRVLTLRTFT